MYLHFGGSVINGANIPGIQFVCTNVDVHGYSSGLYAFTGVQVIFNHSITRYKADGSITNAIDDNGLDNTYPYQILGDGDGSQTFDDPGFNIVTNDLGIQTTQTFRMTLLFQPDEPSVPVPVKQIDWRWTGQATNVAGAWILVQPGSAGAITANNQNTVSYPIWTNVVLNRN